jgi:uncharacterized protein YdiU (UPF0061 family)
MTALLADLGDSYAQQLPELATPWQADEVEDPVLLAFSDELAAELGLDADQLKSKPGIAILVGNVVPPGSTPVALGYAGHQFGGYSPRLGDGRALLLGELNSSDGNRVDLHLKGSGRTPWARGGDGKASVGPMLREYVFAEAMHALGVPTTRALAVLGTGEKVIRQGIEPGALLVRTAASHLRVGTFEYAVRLEDETVLRRLADHAIHRHYPHLADTDNPYLGLLEAVLQTQAKLVAQWMQIGFIHGVLNTDNVTISGETIDYGPCAFMDSFDPATVFSSIDHGGRYAYGNQPAITQWNLTRLAETLIPLIDDDSDRAIELATEVIHTFSGHFQAAWLPGMLAKIGLSPSADTTVDEELVNDLLGLMHAARADYTTTFRALADTLRDDTAPVASLIGDAEGLASWQERWSAALGDADPVATAQAMDSINPIYIPRNHLVEEALDAAVDGDHKPFHELLAAVTNPYVRRKGLERFAEPAPDEFNDGFRTFCGT